MKKIILISIFLIIISLSLASALSQSYEEEYLTTCEDDGDCFFNGNGVPGDFECYNPLGYELGYCVMACDFDLDCSGFPVNAEGYSCEPLPGGDFCLAKSYDNDIKEVCEEFDGGDNYNLASYAVGYSGSDIVSAQTDHCTILGDSLVEYTCDGYNFVEEVIDCADVGDGFTCSDGACIDPSGRPIDYEQSCHPIAGSDCSIDMACVDDDCLYECSVNVDCPTGNLCADSGYCEKTTCNDGIDNDGDGQTASGHAIDPSYVLPDSVGSACRSHDGCGDHVYCIDNICRVTKCNDGIDNDNDGTFDQDDPNCAGYSDNTEASSRSTSEEDARAVRLGAPELSSSSAVNVLLYVAIGLVVLGAILFGIYALKKRNQ
jgi:hypothetical protein